MKKILLLLALISPLLFSQEVLSVSITECGHLDLKDTLIKANISCKGKLKIYNSTLQNSAIKANEVVLKNVKITGTPNKKSVVYANRLILNNVKINKLKSPTVFYAKQIKVDNLKVGKIISNSIFDNKSGTDILIKNSDIKGNIVSKKANIDMFKSFYSGNLMVKRIRAINVVMSKSNINVLQNSSISNAVLVHTKTSKKVSINNSITTDKNSPQYVPESSMMSIVNKSAGCGLIPGKLSKRIDGLNKSGLGLNTKNGECNEEVRKILKKSIYDTVVDENAERKKIFEMMNKRKPKKDTRSYYERNPDLKGL